MTYERLGAFFPSSLAFRATLLLKYAVLPFTFQLKPSNEQYSCSNDGIPKYGVIDTRSV